MHDGIEERPNRNHTRDFVFIVLVALAIGGVAVGLVSVVIPTIAVVVGIFVANHFAGLYGVAVRLMLYSLIPARTVPVRSDLPLKSRFELLICRDMRYYA